MGPEETLAQLRLKGLVSGDCNLIGARWETNGIIFLLLSFTNFSYKILLLWSLYMFNSCLSIRTGLELSSKSCHRLGFELQFRANSLRSFWQWCLPRPERDLHTVPASIALRLLRSVPVAFATRTFQMHIDHRGLRPRWSGVKPCEANLGSRFVSGFNTARA